MSKFEITPQEKKLTRQLFYRSFALECSFNFEKMQALGFAWAMFPAIHEFCGTQEEQVEALKRHTAFFNVTPHISTFLLGMAASMEKEAAEKKAMDPAAINAIKVSLMGPLSGIGDSFFWGTFRVIAAGVGISLAQQGNVLGPILFLILFNVPHLVLRYYCTVWGYVLGSKFIQTSYENGLIHHMTKLATVIGLTTVGAMIATMVSFNIGLTVQIGEMELVVQEIFDQIMPNLLPLVLSVVVYHYIQKGVSVNKLLFLLLGLGILLTAVGFFPMG